jgi:hypothetical protein
MKKFSNSNRGFTLFAAVIVSGILVLISFAISAISTREISLSNLNRESGQAIFAANAGIECALYWDTKFVVSSPPVVYGSAFDISSARSLTCNNVVMNTGIDLNTYGTTTVDAIVGGGPMSVFGFSLNSAQNPSRACVVVTVNKYFVGPDLVTDVFSRGYNNCDTTDPRRVERGIQVRY